MNDLKLVILQNGDPYILDIPVDKITVGLFPSINYIEEDEYSHYENGITIENGNQILNIE